MELKEKAKKLREAANTAEAKAKEAEKKKAKDAKKLREAADKAEAEAKKAEAAAKEADENESETEAEESEDEGGDPEDPEHDDAAQDMELIKKMVAQILGKGADKDETEESEKLAHEAYQAHKEMGKEKDEAMSHAGEALKLARHMASKQAEAEESEDEGGDDGKKPPKKKPAPKSDDDSDGGDDDGDNDESMESENKSDLKKRLLESEGRIAALEAKLKESTVATYVDEQLKKSGLPVSVTKRFREAAGKIKSKADFDAKWKVFQEGVKDFRPEVDWEVIAEKSTAGGADDDDGGSGNKKLDFSDCAED